MFLRFVESPSMRVETCLLHWNKTYFLSEKHAVFVYKYKTVSVSYSNSSSSNNNNNM
jgi:hypothetical protein